MPKEQYFGDGIPDRLRQISVEGMLIEKLYTLDTVMDDSELSDLDDEVEFNNDAIYVDKTQAGGLGRLAIDKRCAVKSLDKIDPADFNSVILMKAYVQDGDNLRCGVIADCRFTKDHLVSIVERKLILQIRKRCGKHLTIKQIS